MQRSNAIFLHGAGAWGGQWLIWQRLFTAAGWRTQAPDRVTLPPAPWAAQLAAFAFEPEAAVVP